MLQYLKKFFQNKYLWVAITCIGYLIFGYQLHRSNFELLVFLYSVLFISFLVLVNFQKTDFKFLITISILFRVVLLFSAPSLSDDYYRFIWDGRMIWEGLNPYLFLPEADTSLVAEGEKLYQGMGNMNGSHYTCYPPINQLTFLIPALFFSKSLLGSTVIMRLLIVFADLIALYFGQKLLELFKLPKHKIFYYFLNPFIILELTGNLHFEGVMIAFLAIAFYYLFSKKWFISSIAFSIAISIKLIPLLFLPLLYKYLGLKKSIYYYASVLVFNILFFIPFVSQELIDNFMSSIHLYFQNFEFNASIYYIIRKVGFYIKGYNIIQTVGKITPIVVLISVLLIAFFRKNNLKKQLINSMLFAILIYYALASIVHPWYIAIPLFLSIFTHHKFPLVWSFFIILSYAAYRTEAYHENLLLVTVEYLFVYGTLIYEFFFQNKTIQKLKKHSS